MITGTLTRNAGGTTFTLSVATLTFDLARLSVVPNAYKTADTHPDHHIEVRTPRGRTMRVGSMWSAVARTSRRPRSSGSCCVTRRSPRRRSTASPTPTASATR